MVRRSTFNRGDIVRVNLKPTTGREQQGDFRPALVLSPAAFNLIRLLAVLGALFLTSDLAAAAEADRPVGKNCLQSSPDANAGENGGHGVFLQVFPRNADIGPTYTGCQAVFVTTAKEPTRLAWLIEVQKGDPVRRWSDDEELRATLHCKYKQGTLVKGDPGTCPNTAPQLMASFPAGCMQGTRSGEQCEPDGD